MGAIRAVAIDAGGECDPIAEGAVVKRNDADPLCRYCTPMWGSQPSPLTYRQWLNGLAAAEMMLESGQFDQGERLRGMAAMLRDVARYIADNPFAKQLRLATSLVQIASALNDVSQGANPALFQNVSKRGGAPAFRTRTVLRARVILLFNMWARLGLDHKTIGSLLADELAKAGVKEDGKVITPKMIVSWHNTVKGDALKGLNRLYKKLEREFLVEYRGWPTEIKARQIMRHSIHSLRLGFGGF